MEEKLVNSILNDMLTSEDHLTTNWFGEVPPPPPPPPAPVDNQSEKSLLRQALISKRTKNKSSVETPPPQCNPLSTYKLEPMNKVNGNSDFLDLDSLVYNEIDKHSSKAPENNNCVSSSCSAPNTSKLLSCLARGGLLPLLPGVRLPDTPLPASSLFPGSVIRASPDLPKTSADHSVKLKPVTVPQCTVIQLPTSNIRLEMEVIDHLLKKSEPEEQESKSSTKNRKVNLKKRKSLPSCVQEVKKARVVGGERASVDSVLLEARLQPTQP